MMAGRMVAWRALQMVALRVVMSAVKRVEMKAASWVLTLAEMKAA